MVKFMFHMHEALNSNLCPGETSMKIVKISLSRKAHIEFIEVGYS